jgi:hypothetical protein
LVTGRIVKLLIDECFSPTLVSIARERGFSESICVLWPGMSGQGDPMVAPRAVDVTQNTADCLPLSGAGRRSCAERQRRLKKVCLTKKNKGIATKNQSIGKG